MPSKCDRPELQRLLNALEPGSVIVVTRLDRLARSTIDLLTTIKQIADKGCLFNSLADPWADTTTPGGRLMLTVLGGLAEFERELIKARTMEGRERAKRSGFEWVENRYSVLTKLPKSAAEKRMVNQFVSWLGPTVLARIRFRE